MFHIIQENLFREKHYNDLIKIIQRAELPHEIVKLDSNTEQIVYNTKEKNVMLWGSVKIARLGEKYNWFPSSFLNKNHDYMVYSDKYKHHLFNFDSKLIDVNYKGDLPNKFFARPTNDNKLFTGKVFERDTFQELLQSVKGKKRANVPLIQISTIKNIQSEARFWVIKGKVITGSYYKRGGQYYINEITDCEEIWQFAQKMVNIYELAEAFVIDICMSNGKYKIMECGCINSAGFYDSNIGKIVNELEKEFNVKFPVME